MSVELDEVRKFLSEHEPFSHLPDDELDALPFKMEIIYVRRGETVITAGEPNDTLYVIRSGAVDVLDSQDVLLDRRGTGRFFGHSTIVTKGGFGAEPGPSRYTMIAVEDSLLLTMEREEVRGLIERNPEVARYFAGVSERIRAAAERLSVRSGSDALRTRVGDLVDRDPVSVHCEATVREAAQLMSENGISCLPVISDTADGADDTDDTDGGGVASLLPPVAGNELVGIITDRDLRNRVIAEGVDTDTPVSGVMTRDPFSTTADTTAFEAMLMMSEQGVHHLPVVGGLDGGGDGVTGVISASDIMRALRNDPIYLTADLVKATDAEQMRSIVKDTAEMTSGFISRGASAEEVSEILTVCLDSLARRLLVLAEERLGPPPVPYAFIVLGSQARRAVGFSSDQDNGLVLHNSYDEDLHGEYFAELGRMVCTGLGDAGQRLCPGDMMAMNPAWRMTVDQWKDSFHTWVTAPHPDALLNAQTFFDMRPIYGARELADQVHRYSVALARSSSRFHARLAALAARTETPLGIFRGLVVQRGGDYRNTLDVKAGGTAPIVQIARLYALMGGVKAVGTHQRLAQAAAKGVLTQKAARDLTEAFNFLKALSLRHQAGQLRSGEEANYRIDPDSLGKLDRENLRDAFGIIKGIQTSLAVKYPVRNT
ncbi:putative nucleotidyltransferase substrate binding domain-containing protein [Corynebacterium sp.]|uniref:putative nucleotidyltransferase substrate binding domain-containing protein n=1 Tax=Corynebacterium sp. TaxID=1720 RepID=UPI0025C61FEE|nr:putative nucleotidyltransferase substrate binding domain-containing protein [Corynebacterium sp.]